MTQISVGKNVMKLCYYGFELLTAPNFDNRKTKNTSIDTCGYIIFIDVFLCKKKDTIWLVRYHISLSYLMMGIITYAGLKLTHASKGGIMCILTLLLM